MHRDSHPDLILTRLLLIHRTGCEEVESGRMERGGRGGRGGEGKEEGWEGGREDGEMGGICRPTCNQYEHMHCIIEELRTRVV